MRIACIATSQIPSTTANSIQVMKVCQALALAAPDADVHLWVPGKNETPWEQLAGQYGVQAPFTIHWVPSQRAFRRYDLIWSAYRAARRWGADLFYTWLPQVALLALREVGQPKAPLEGVLIYVPTKRPETDEQKQANPFALYAECGAVFPQDDGDEYLSLCLRARPDHATEIRQVFATSPSGPTFAVIDA
ncbi:MAG TPA: hypothetical protein PLV53_03380, partial [Anaerolineaceae bacterium]|nr:hypothetical protein [Anaerolineaceae bacterium]